MTYRQNQITDTKVTSVTIKRYSKLDQVKVSKAYSQGGVVNIFDLLELISKPICKGKHENVVLRKIIENLKPCDTNFNKDE